VLILARRHVRPTKSPAAAYCNDIGIDPNLRLNVGIDLPDIAAVVHVFSVGADRNNAVSRRNANARSQAQSRIAAVGTVNQRIGTDRRVERACGIAGKRTDTDGRVGGAGATVRGANRTARVV
jgi:hypothetical protein